MPLGTLKEFLNEHQMQYESMAHSAAFTARETTESAHIPGRDFAP